jgi:hypothetical protein
MNKRQKKKFENRAGFFHYCDYKLRVKILYDIFGSVVNHDAPYVFKQYMFNWAKHVLFTKAPTEIFDRKYRRHKMPELENYIGYRFGRFDDIVTESESIEHMNSAVFDLRKNNKGEDVLENDQTAEKETQET